MHESTEAPRSDLVEYEPPAIESEEELASLVLGCGFSEGDECAGSGGLTNS